MESCKGEVVRRRYEGEEALWCRYCESGEECGRTSSRANIGVSRSTGDESRDLMRVSKIAAAFGKAGELHRQSQKPVRYLTDQPRRGRGLR